MTQSSDPTGSEETTESVISEGEIDEVLKESFPASDPPPWTLGIEPHIHPKGTDDEEGDETPE